MGFDLGGLAGGVGGLVDASSYYATYSANARQKEQSTNEKRARKLQQEALEFEKYKFAASLALSQRDAALQASQAGAGQTLSEPPATWLWIILAGAGVIALILFLK